MRVSRIQSFPDDFVFSSACVKRNGKSATQCLRVGLDIAHAVRDVLVRCWPFHKLCEKNLPKVFEKPSNVFRAGNACTACSMNQPFNDDSISSTSMRKPLSTSKRFFTILQAS